MPGAQGEPDPKTGQGSDPPEGSDEEKPKYLTLDAFRAEFNKAYASRASETERRLAKQTTGAIEAAFEGFKGTITEGFAGLLDERLKALTPKEPPKDPKGEVAPPKLEESPQFLALQQELADQKAASAKLLAKQELAEKKAADARAKSRATSLEADTVKAFAALGLDDARARAAAKVQIKANGTVRYPDDDTDTPAYFNGEDDFVALADGLKAWLKSDEGKLYVPPKGAAGSGGGPGGPAGHQQRASDPLLDAVTEYLNE